MKNWDTKKHQQVLNMKQIKKKQSADISNQNYADTSTESQKVPYPITSDLYEQEIDTNTLIEMLKWS